MSAGSLKTYRKKRNFRHTPEPKGKSTGGRSKKPIFVIQKHAARQLHYDFRLQLGRALKSWAVPKGPSLNPSDKRMAVEVEDHPLGYAKFEGVIPKGEYGAGTVMIWDKGSYRNVTKKNNKEVPITRALRNGHLTIELDGGKIEGRYALSRIVKGKKPRWLLVKVKDAKADARQNPVKSENKSAVSGRTMKQIEKEEKD